MQIGNQTFSDIDIPLDSLSSCVDLPFGGLPSYDQEKPPVGESESKILCCQEEFFRSSFVSIGEEQNHRPLYDGILYRHTRPVPITDEYAVPVPVGILWLTFILSDFRSFTESTICLWKITTMQIFTEYYWLKITYTENQDFWPVFHVTS